MANLRGEDARIEHGDANMGIHMDNGNPNVTNLKTETTRPTREGWIWIASRPLCYARASSRGPNADPRQTERRRYIPRSPICLWSRGCKNIRLTSELQGHWINESLEQQVEPHHLDLTRMGNGPANVIMPRTRVSVSCLKSKIEFAHKTVVTGRKTYMKLLHFNDNDKCDHDSITLRLQ